jgi:hypothetical protein
LRSERGSLKKFFESQVLTCTQSDCLIWPFPSKSSKGYAMFWWEGRTRIVSRIVCELVYGPAPSAKHNALHTCGKGDLACVNPRHIYWGTQKDNMADRLKHGTANRGERHGLSKLTENDVRQIRSLALTMTQRQIAKQFDLTFQAINDIVRRKNWGWLE